MRSHLREQPDRTHRQSDSNGGETSDVDAGGLLIARYRAPFPSTWAYRATIAATWTNADDDGGPAGGRASPRPKTTSTARR